MLARTFIERSGPAALMRLRAVVCRPGRDPVADLRKRASLLRTDSIHGAFNATIEVDEDNLALIANGNRIPFIYAPVPMISTTAAGDQRCHPDRQYRGWKTRAGWGNTCRARASGKCC